MKFQPFIHDTAVLQTTPSSRISYHGIVSVPRQLLLSSPLTLEQSFLYDWLKGIRIPSCSFLASFFPFFLVFSNLGAIPGRYTFVVCRTSLSYNRKIAPFLHIHPGRSSTKATLLTNISAAWTVVFFFTRRHRVCWWQLCMDAGALK